MYITSNGSKWLGQPPDPPKRLIEVFGLHKPLPWSHAEYDRVSDTIRLFGNFEDVSHVFNICGSLNEMLPLLMAFKASWRRYYPKRSFCRNEYCM